MVKIGDKVHILIDEVLKRSSNSHLIRAIAIDDLIYINNKQGLSFYVKRVNSYYNYLFVLVSEPEYKSSPHFASEVIFQFLENELKVIE